MGTLFVVATPIGNLKDITSRALEVLREANLVLAEDTRVAKRLLVHYAIMKPVKRYDEHVNFQIYRKVKECLAKGGKIAFVTDAGTPGISDPGSRLIRFIREELPGTNITPIPGPSALIAALSVSGFNADRFTFLGFPPHKKGRKTFFASLPRIETKPLVLYESPHRIRKTLGNLIEVFGEEKEIVIARELTKLYEEVFSGSIEKALEYFQGERLRGEFVLMF